MTLKALTLHGRDAQTAPAQRAALTTLMWDTKDAVRSKTTAGLRTSHRRKTDQRSREKAKVVIHYY